MSMGKTGFYSFGNRLQRVKGDDDSGTAHNWKTLLLLLSRPRFRDDNPSARAGKDDEDPDRDKILLFSLFTSTFPFDRLERVLANGLSISNLTGVASAVGIPVQSSSRDTRPRLRIPDRLMYAIMEVKERR